MPIGPRPPKHLTPAQKKIYRELVANAAPDTLSMADTIILEVATLLTEKLRDYGIKTTARPDGLTSAELTSLTNLLGKLGYTPVDRVRASVVPAKSKPVPEADPLADFI